MTLESERLLLRPWTDEDAGAMYQYASDPVVAPSAGWAVYTSVAHSRDCRPGVWPRGRSETPHHYVLSREEWQENSK